MLDNLSFDLQEIKKQNYQIDSVSNNKIAVIGIGTRLPSCSSLDDFWLKICHGVDFIRDIPLNRKKDIKSYLKFKNINNYGFYQGAYLDEIDKFDYKYFGLSPREAQLMDPNQRIFLETTWNAIEDAGYGGGLLKGSKTGVFLGYGDNTDYKNLISEIDLESVTMSTTGNLRPIIASRIAYLLDLKGPNMLINTTCSSSLVAVHLACNAINNQECDLAIAGGVKLYLFPYINKKMDKLEIESSTGRTKTFDDSSDGTGGGEGVISILLKPLSKAIQDRDNIYAVICGSAVNHDGTSNGITAPNALAQEEVIKKALYNAKVSPESIGYIEAHGTGTKLGDPIEIYGISKAFHSFTNKKQFCALGSIKANLGHLDSAAGIAGLLKAILILRNKKIPPLIHFKIPNKNIDFMNSPVYINEKLMNWEKNNGPRRCGVSSFGLSGTNCHIILEESHHYLKQIDLNKTDQDQIITFSANSEITLKQLLKEFIDYLTLNNQLNISDICYTQNTGRDHYPIRIALIVKSVKNLLNKLKVIYYSDFNNIDNVQIFYKKNQQNSFINSEQTNQLNNYFIDKCGQQLNQNQLGQICNDYINGALLNWNLIYDKTKFNRVRIPVYPFKKGRCWIGIPLRNNRIKKRVKNTYYRLQWKKNESVKQLKENRLQSVLIIRNEYIPCEDNLNTFIDHIKDRNPDYIEVVFGNEFKKVYNNFYIIDGKLKSYNKLFSNISKEKINDIIYLANQNYSNDYMINHYKEIQLKEFDKFYNLLHFFNGETNKEINIMIISKYINYINDQQLKVCSEQSLIFGLIQSINLEYSHINCRGIDTDDKTDINQIYNELKLNSTTPYVAYRNNHRFTQELAEVKLSKLPKSNLTIVKNGVYIITGGLGVIGLELAKYLSFKNTVNIILLNRSNLPEESKWDKKIDDNHNLKLINQINTIKEIRKSGSKVYCYSIDITDKNAFDKILASIRKQFTKINGVIHCAAEGVGKIGKKLLNEDKNILHKVILPKLYGTFLCDQLTKTDNLDFLLFFSSPITLMGGIGSSIYASVNYFVESYFSQRKLYNPKTYIISWSTWKKSLILNKSQFDNKKALFHALTTKKAVMAVDSILKYNYDFTMIAGNMHYNCELLKYKDFFPLDLSKQLKNKVNKLNIPKINKLSNNHVVVTGRSDNNYTLVEKNVANCFAQVLGYKNININDDFYQLGGDSIIAAKVINILKSSYQYNIKISDLFQLLNIANIAKFISEKNNTKLDQYEGMSKVEQKEYYITSYEQKEIYIHNQFENIGLTYNMPEAYVIYGVLDLEKLTKTFDILIQRHEIFRTSFHIKENDIYQKVHKKVNFKIDVIPTHQYEIESIIYNQIKPFNLEQAPLLKALLLKVHEKKHVLLIDMHHIISDGVSKSLFIKEFIKIYNNQKLMDVMVNYKDYAEWQKLNLQSENFNKQKEFWLRQFYHPLNSNNFPLDFKRPAINHFIGDNVEFELNQDQLNLLKTFSVETGSSIFMILFSIYSLLLAHYIKKEDIIIGILSDGRTFSQLTQMMGLFLKFLPIRSYPQKNKKYINYLSEIKECLTQAYDNQDYPVYEIVNILKQRNQIQNNSLYQTMFIMQNIKMPEINLNNLILSKFSLKFHTSRLDFVLEAEEIENQLRFRLEFNPELFKRSTMVKLSEDFINVFNIIIKEKNILLKNIKFYGSKISPNKDNFLVNFNFNQ